MILRKLFDAWGQRPALEFTLDWNQLLSKPSCCSLFGVLSFLGIYRDALECKEATLQPPEVILRIPESIRVINPQSADLTSR